LNAEINPGTQLGRYVVISALGRGGMGEVYEARDTKIGRRVAIKLLPATLSSHKNRIHRFENEAKAAGGLNHPNLLIVYDVGTHNGSPYLVSELLEGETLRDRITGAKLPPRMAIDYARQIADGLAAAHETGIIHRDLKPENLFITNGDRVKILDFGLAKLVDSERPVEARTDASTVRPLTNPGAIIGTVGYMSPEQVRGLETVDHRSDIFSFGVVLYEMLKGSKAFVGDSTVETMNAILKEDPFESRPLDQNIEPALDRIVRHCLEKKPENRFQSARDLAFGLEGLANPLSSSSASRAAIPQPSNRKSYLAVGLLLVAVAIALSAFFVGKSWGGASTPVYRQLTFRRGTISSARFAVDGQTIYYSAAWNGDSIGIFSTRSENPESRALGMTNADILSISSTGEMAVLLNRRYVAHFIHSGTLARMPLLGGAPRELLEDVQQADWSPDGSSLAVVHRRGEENQLEFPIGKILYSTSGYITYPRISPKGDAIAFFDHPTQRDNRGSVALIDLQGKKQMLTGEWADAQGLAWSPKGDEIWFTASRQGENLSLHAVSTSGQYHAVLRVPNNLMIHDISRDGRLLLTSFTEITAVSGLAPGETKERDLSWLDRGNLFDLSADGKTFVFQYYGEGSGTNYVSYLRRTDGSPAIRLGNGAAVSLSPDGRWVLTVLNDPKQILLLATGPGEARRFDLNGIEDHGNYSWFPDGNHIFFVGKEPPQGLRCYSLDVNTGKVRAITAEGITGNLVSPDGKFFVSTNSEQARFIYPIEGGKPRLISGLENDEEIIRWSADGQALFVYRRNALPIRVFRLNLISGRKELWKEVTPSDPTGIFGRPKMLLSADGKSYVYQFHRHLSDLYIVERVSSSNSSSLMQNR